MNDLKKCPFCAEEIKTTAKKCKHCGEWLNKNDNIQTETSQPASSNIAVKTGAMKMASIGSTLSFLGLILSPLFSIPGITLGIIAFASMTPEEKNSGWDGKSVKNRALTAILAGVIATALWAIYIIKWALSGF